MKTSIELRNEQIELESCLETFRIYENTFKRNLLSDMDKIEENRNVQDDSTLTVNTLFDMCNVIWALAVTADESQSLNKWKRYDPAEILKAYSVATALVVDSFQISPKNALAANQEKASQK